MRKGYTLLEVLVSLAILSTAMIAVYQVFFQGFGTLERLHRYQDLYLAANELVHEIELIENFKVNRERRGTIGNFTYEWTAVPQGPEQTMPGFEDNPAPFILGLYKIVIKISDPQKNRQREFTVFKVGWIHA
jgi:prepilin-type N-terminal cleavage/methylation domain-containing protein